MQSFVSARRLVVTGLSAAALAPWGSVQADATKANVGFYPAAFLSFPAFVAKEEGFFSRNGLDVNLVPIPNGAAMTSAVTSGSIDFANNSWDNLIIAVDKGLPLKAVAGATVKLPLALVARNVAGMPSAEAGYPNTVRAFEGKKIGVIGLGISTHYLAQELVEGASLSSKSVHYIAVGLPANARPALRNGSIDAYMSLWPLPAILEASKEGSVAVNLAKNEGPQLLRDLNYNGWWATDKTLKQNPQTVQKFIQANAQAYCWYRDRKNLPRLIEILKKYVPVPDLSDEQYQAMVADTLPAYGAALSDSSFERWQKILLDKKQISRNYGIDEIVAPSALRDVVCE